jgi:hypothetical protein
VPYFPLGGISPLQSAALCQAAAGVGATPSAVGAAVPAGAAAAAGAVQAGGWLVPALLLVHSSAPLIPLGRRDSSSLHLIRKPRPRSRARCDQNLYSLSSRADDALINHLAAAVVGPPVVYEPAVVYAPPPP